MAPSTKTDQQRSKSMPSVNIGTIHPGTILGQVVSNTPLGLAPTLTVQGQRLLVMGYDNGNGDCKTAVRHANDDLLVMRTIPSTIGPGGREVFGEGRFSYRVNGTAPFCLGHEVGPVGGETLPVGTTDIRLSDPRQVQAMVASMVETLVAAEYQPGAYSIVLGFGVPNAEVERDGLVTEVRQVLQSLVGTSFSVVRTDPRRGAATWTIVLAGLTPFAQTSGTFFSWYYSGTGVPVQTNIRSVQVCDIGYNDTQVFSVQIREDGGRDSRMRITATGQRVGDGIILVGNALVAAIQAEYGIALSPAAVRDVLVQRKLLVGGVWQEIGALIDRVARDPIQQILTRLQATFQEPSSFILGTGGGTLLLHDQITTQMSTLKRKSGSFFLLPPGVAAQANVAGIYFQAYLLTTASSKRKQS